MQLKLTIIPRRNGKKRRFNRLTNHLDTKCKCDWQTNWSGSSDFGTFWIVPQCWGPLIVAHVGPDFDGPERQPTLGSKSGNPMKGHLLNLFDGVPSNYQLSCCGACSAMREIIFDYEKRFFHSKRYPSNPPNGETHASICRKEFLSTKNEGFSGSRTAGRDWK